MTNVVRNRNDKSSSKISIPYQYNIDKNLNYSEHIYSLEKEKKIYKSPQRSANYLFLEIVARVYAHGQGS